MSLQVIKIKKESQKMADRVKQLINEVKTQDDYFDYIFDSF